jgi:hypothetical protein
MVLRPARFLATVQTFGSRDGGFSDSSRLLFAEDGKSFTLADEFGEIVAVKAAPARVGNME